MSEFKHTPGPWSVVDSHYPSMQEIQGPSFKINIVMSATDLNFQDYLSRSADARLIAAAPDLLEALKLCCFALEPYDDIKPRDWITDRANLRDAHEVARAAIAKATTQQDSSE